MKKISHNSLYNEDCVETMKRMPNDFIDLVVTSPPYDNLRKYKGDTFDLEQISENLFRIMKKGGIIVWIVGDQTIKGNETATSFKQALLFKEKGFNLFDTMIYQKTPRGAVGNNKTYWQTFEYMFIFSKDRPKTINLIHDRENKQSRKGDRGTKRLFNGELKPTKRAGYKKYGRRTNVWEYLVGKGHSSTDDIAYEHPAIFPEKLVEDHIVSWSNKGDLIYDPFLGSGTTAKVATSLGRNWIGSEISEQYCIITKKRLESIQSITN
jgi:site-specific DNA-methyltransferase (adenine-specific)